MLGRWLLWIELNPSQHFLNYVTPFINLILVLVYVVF